MVDGITTQAVGQAAGSMVVPAIDWCGGIFKCLKRKYGYVKHIEKNFEKLKDEEKILDDQKGSEETEVQCDPTMMPTVEYEQWVKSVEDVQQKIQQLETEHKKIRRCFYGLCPIHRLFKHGRQIVKKTKRIVYLKERFDKMQKRRKKPIDPFIERDATNIEHLPSLYDHVRTVLEFLVNDTFEKIWIWGPEGVGKTTIMENVHNAIGKTGNFDIIFWAEGSIKDIQEKLLGRLRINWDRDSSDEQRAELISGALMNMKYVLFLDGVSSDIDLNSIGIRSAHRKKVVLTSRHRNYSEDRHEVKVLGLSYEDGKMLFWEIVGERLQNKRDFNSVADKIIRECGGMTFMIKAIGTKLATENDLEIWEDQLVRLRTPIIGKRNYLNQFCNGFKVVLDGLEENEQSCILYWAVFPVGSELHQDYITECWRAAQFFQEFTKLGKARARGQAILAKLTSNSLLLKTEKTSCYKMVENYHKVAMAECEKIGCITLVKESSNIHEEEWDNVNRLSMLLCSLPCTLPVKPTNISTLLLRKSILSEMPALFFQHMGLLQLLDLHHATIKLLPQSISRLENLRALFLYDCCQLMRLPAEIENLKMLEILDIRKTGILGLPTEIKNLINLKCLRFSFAEDDGTGNHTDAGLGKMIYSGIISPLLLLEELIIAVPDPNNKSWKQNVETITGEAAALKELETFHFYFPTVESFQKFIEGRESSGNNNWRSFYIVVGCQPRTEFDVSGCSAVKHLRFSTDVGIPIEISTILNHACSFELIGHKDAANLSVFGSDNLEELEICIIEDCNAMTSVIDDHGMGGPALKNLNELHIKNLSELVRIWEGPIGSESLHYLTTLAMEKCHRVKALFSMEVVLRLNKLKYLQVEDCELIEEIIESGNQVDFGVFPALKNLKLTDLPKLSTVCNNISLEGSSLEKITVKTCGELTNFPFAFQNVTWLTMTCIIEDCNAMTNVIDGYRTGGLAYQNLNELHIKNLPSLVHIWEGLRGSESLSNLTTLTIKTCRSMKTLFLEEVVLRLNKLEYLQVENCELIEEIIKSGSQVESEVFPALKNLKLTDLPKLSTICNNVSLNWSSLEEITIKTCGALTSFPYAFQKVTNLRVIVCNRTWFDGLDWQNYTDLRRNLLRNHRPI